MTKAKNTKRALLLSVLSLMLCMAMLVGSTFAWFTDNVTSGVNRIVAGNLDVELEYATFSVDEETNETVTTWKSVEGESLFDENALWEPGYTQVVYLKVRNAGTLALKYKLSVNSLKETEGTNEDGEAIKLSKYLVFGQVESDTLTTYATREDAWKAAGITTGLNNYTKDSKLAAGAEEYVALVVYMPTTVGNEANYRGETVPTIELGINLVATQNTVENDSFDEKYDENAWNDTYTKANDDGTYSDGENTYVKIANKYIAVSSTDVDGLYTDADNNNYVANEDAIQSVVENTEKGETVNFTVLKDITLSKRITASGDLTINGEGNTLNVERTSSNSDRVIDLSYTTEKTTITLNNVDLVGPQTGTYNRGISLYDNKNVTVVLDNCSVSTNYYALNVAGLNENVDIVIKNTDLTGYAAINLWSKSNITLENCTLTGENPWAISDWNNFAVVVFTSDSTTSSAGSTLTCKDCTFVSNTAGNKEYFFRVGVDDVTINLENCTFIYNNDDVTDIVKSDIADGKSQGGSDYLMWYEGRNTVFNVD